MRQWINLQHGRFSATSTPVKFYLRPSAYGVWDASVCQQPEPACVNSIKF